MNTAPIEPYRIRMVEPVKLLPKEERLKRLNEASWNVFRLRSEDIFIDLLTDSGTGAMSIYQWAALMMGDEAYAGARSWFKFEEAVRDVLGIEYVLPVHQGRAAERILYTTLMDKRNAKIVPANTHFDTGRAVILNHGGRPLDLPVPEAKRPKLEAPFKGDMDTSALKKLIEKEGADKIAFILLVLTNNTIGGQPVSMDNIRAVKEISEEYNIPLVMDICRFAENAYFIKIRDERYRNKSISEIVKEMLSYGDHFIMSAKKDGLANIGGFIGTRSRELYEELAGRVVLEEGFITYGGLAGRDLEAIAQGLREVIDEDYLKHRIEQVKYFGELMEELGVPVIKPIGGHAVYVDALEAIPHIPREQFPADALAAFLYLESGVRAVGLGALAFAREENGKIVYPDFELLRLAVPRRTYTSSQLEYVARSLASLLERKEKIKGLKVIWEPKVKGVRHFLAKLAPVEKVSLQ